MFFVRLSVVMPGLDHATWHLYRRVLGAMIAAQNMDVTYPFWRAVCKTQTTFAVVVGRSHHGGTFRLSGCEPSSRRRAPPLSHRGLAIAVYCSQGCGVSR